MKGFNCFVLQGERSFQHQPTIFLNRKKCLPKKHKAQRYTRKVGLGIKTPSEVTWRALFWCSAQKKHSLASCLPASAARMSDWLLNDEQSV